MSAQLKIDDKAFREALTRFAENSRKSGEEVLRNQARLFVQDAVKITPPNQDYKLRRKLGEAAIAADIRKIMRGSNARDAIDDPAALHQKYRRRTTGRVAKERAIKFKVRNLAAYIKSVQERVGILASGWNAAAAKLGARMPDWIKRHGSSGGSIRIKLSLLETRITIANSVKFVGSVKDLARRVQHALNTRAGAMNRQLADFQKRSARKAGFR